MPLHKVSFVLTCGDTLPGCHVRVVGSCRALGHWQPRRGLALQTSAAEFPTWRSPDAVTLDEDEAIEYKFVICDDHSHAVRWEAERPNRHLHLASLWGHEVSPRSGARLMVTETFNAPTEADELRFFTISDASPDRSGRFLVPAAAEGRFLVPAAAERSSWPPPVASVGPGVGPLRASPDEIDGHAPRSSADSRWPTRGGVADGPLIGIDGGEWHPRSLFEEAPNGRGGTSWLLPGRWRSGRLWGVALSAPLASISEIAAHGWEGPPETVRLLLSASVWLGTFMLWSFEYAIVVPYFTSVLGFDSVDAGLMWMAGPISSLLVSPVVGVLSDRCRSRYGRRRPFIFGGVCMTIVSVTIFVMAPWVALPGSRASRCVAGVGFCCMDLSINVVQNSARALLSDIAGPRWQVRAQAVIALLCGFGYILGFLVLWQTPDLLGHIVSIHVLGCTVLIGTTAATLHFAVESPTLVREQRSSGAGVQGSVAAAAAAAVAADADESAKDMVHEGSQTSASSDDCQVARQVCAHFVNLYKAVVAMPKGVKQIMVCHTLSWFGWFCFLQILTQYFGVIVYGGDPLADCQATPGDYCLQPTCNPCMYQDDWVACRQLCMYQGGISAGTLGLFLQNLVTIFVSLSFALFQRHFGLRRCYRVTLAIQAAMLFLLAIKSNDSNLALFFVAMTGISQAGTQVFPYALIGSVVVDPGTKGLAMGVLTLSAAVPQFIDTTYVTWLAQKMGLRCVVALGGCYAASAFFVARWLPVDGNKSRLTPAQQRISERYRPLLEATHDGNQIITDANEAVSLLEDVVPRTGCLGSP